MPSDGNSSQGLWPVELTKEVIYRLYSMNCSETVGNFLIKTGDIRDFDPEVSKTQNE